MNKQDINCFEQLIPALETVKFPCDFVLNLSELGRSKCKLFSLFDFSSNLFLRVMEISGGSLIKIRNE